MKEKRITLISSAGEEIVIEVKGADDPMTITIRKESVQLSSDEVADLIDTLTDLNE